MSSDRSRLPLAAILALLVTSLAVAACGKKGPPQPRPRAIPKPATDLALRLRGNELTLTFSYPTSTLAGLPLAGLESITVYEAVRVFAQDAAPADVADLEAVGQPVATLAGASLGAAVYGAQLRVRLPLPGSALAGTHQRIYGVRSQAVGGRISPWSNVVALRPRQTPEPPLLVSVEDREEGIDLTWNAVEDAGGYSILRREATEPLWGEPIAAAGAGETSYLDRSALFGTRYVYAIASRDREDPRLESAPRSEREVDYRDRFAPAPPSELRAVGLADGVRLIWEASPATDLAGYLVERSNSGLRFSAISAEPVQALEITDTDAPRGRLLTYRIFAVDRNGNRSEPSATVDTRRP